MAGIKKNAFGHSPRRKDIRPEKQNIFTFILFAIYILALIGIILYKPPFYSEQTVDKIREINLVPFSSCGLSRDVVYNVLVFIPLGIYISMLKSKWNLIWKLLPIFGLSLAFEVMQYLFALGRSDSADLLANTLGGIVGIGLYAFLFKIFKDKTTKVINILALVFTACALLLVSFLLFLMRRAWPK